MTVNPLGFVMANDFGNPKVLTGEAIETISGGQTVGASGATGVVSSGLSSYVNNDIKFYVCDDSANFVGIAMETVTSGNALAVANDIVVIATAVENTTAGAIVKATASQDGFEPGAAGSDVAGRALTTAGSATYMLVHVHA